MASQFPLDMRQRPRAQDNEIHAEAETLREFGAFLGAALPSYVVRVEWRAARLTPHEREARFAAEDREAMYFYSESHMR